MTEFLTTDDIADIACIEQVCFGGDAWNAAMIKGEFDGGSVFLGVKDNGKTVAYICARIIIDEADINNVAVLPEYRRKGFAKELMDALVGYCRGRGADRFTLEVNSKNIAAKSLYRKLGFTTSGVRKGYYHGDDAEIMWLDKERI